MKLVLPILFLFVAGLASAETSSALYEQIQVAIKAEIKELRNSNDPGAEQKAYRLQNLYTGALSPMFAGTDSNWSRIRNVEAIEAVATSKKLENLCRTVRKQLRAEQEEKENALSAEMEKTFATDLETSLSAKTAKDLDQPIRDVMQSSYQGREYPETSRLRMLDEQGRQLGNFLRELQNYFSGLERHDGYPARAHMTEVIRATGDLCMLMPRSELLARLAAIEAGHKENVTPAETPHLSVERLTEEARRAVIATRTPAQISDTLLKLQSFPRQPSGYGNEFLSHLERSLLDLQKLRADLENGLATNIRLPLVSTSGSTEDNALTDLRLQLVLQAMPRVLGVEKSNPVRPDDNLTTYLNRVIEQARVKSDWALVARIIDFAQTANVGTTLSTSDRGALQSFNAGINQEQARQYAQAVVSFQAALKAGSQLEFASTIGDHLDAIRKDHPKEYDEGWEIVRTPPTPSMPWMTAPRGPATSFPGGLPSGLNQASQPAQPPPSITVPAAGSGEPATQKTSSPASPDATKSN